MTDDHNPPVTSTSVGLTGVSDKDASGYDHKAEAERLPTKPAAYWKPSENMSKVWTLRVDGTWHFNITGLEVNESEVPSDLVHLADFK